MKVVLIIQARMGSNRLPGKVLADLAGRPMLDWVVARARRTRGVDEVVVATSTHAGDDPLAERVSGALGAPVVRGPEDDVLARYLLAAEAHAADVVLRATADCPLYSPMANEGALSMLQDGGFDYVYTWQRRHMPRGTDAEVMTRAALEMAGREAHLVPDREHVTPWLQRNTDRVRVGQWELGQDLAQHRWTVDEPDDLALMRRVYAALPEPLAADIPEVLAVFDAYPALLDVNRHVRQKQWGE